MTERVLGPTGGRRRRWTLLLPLVAVIAVGLMWIAGAQAVHGENFQLDGNVLAASTTNVGGVTQNLDWDSLFDSSGNEKPLPTDFAASGFDRDFLSSGTSFITSDTTTFATGSKDTLPISGWQCNFDNNVNSKIDVMNAYAAEFIDPANGDEILYFGLERNTNTGSANVAFWFLQDDVTCETSGAAATFSGSHTDGDLLVVSEFSGGGTVATINVYRWDGGANGSLNPNAVASGADCRGAQFPATDTVCAVANTVAITTPWPTAAKTLNPPVGNSLPIAQFFEGGVNLTQEDLGGKCFNTFIGDTRSSTSLTSTLFDYSRGQLGDCESGIVTTPRDAAGDTIPAAGLSIGSGSVDVFDRAVITVTGVDDFGGTVAFSLCGPLALNTASNCQSGGAAISTETVTGANGTATVNSDTITLTSIGRYCWRAVYSGDPDTGVPGSSDPADATNISECFKVNPVTPTLTTAASCSATPCVVGSTLSDTATLSGTANQPGTGGLGGAETIAPGSIEPTTAGAPAGGSIAWRALGPDNCTTVAMASTSRTVTGNGTYPKAGQTAVSFVAGSPGLYTFVASYTSDSSGNTNGVAESACPDLTDTEEVTVIGSASLSTAQRWLPNDTATITSQAGTTLAGDVTFKLFPTGNCTGTEVLTQVKDVVTDANPGGTANNRVVSTTNTAFVVTVANDGSAWSWLVSYDDDNLQSPANECETTTPAFTLDD